MNKPEITRMGALSMQVCVPEDFTDQQVTEFANADNPCGTDNGWCIRTDQNLLAGAPVRNPCSERAGCVHVMLDA